MNPRYRKYRGTVPELSVQSRKVLKRLELPRLARPILCKVSVPVLE